jgi:thioesterase domain-containing protein/aryl carrier-like protein
VGLYDDFFESGGDSINALRIMTRLEKVTGRRLPLTSLFKAPTVEKLSLLLTFDNHSVSWESLICIKPGAQKMPIYIVPGRGMNMLTFNNTAKYMDPDQPVYGFQPKGLNGVDEPPDSIEAIAAGYIAEMLKSTPSAGYCLAGYSYGGIVAYEMARQLTAMGKQIYMLAIIDTYADNQYDLERGAARIFRKILRQFRKLLFVMKVLKRNPRETILYQWNFLVRKAKELARLFGDSSFARQLTPEVRVDTKYQLAYRKYRIGLYNGYIDLFRVKTRLYYLDDQEYLGWKPYAKQGVVIHEVSGDHQTLLFPPNDKEFAEALQRTLEERLSLTT